MKAALGLADSSAGGAPYLERRLAVALQYLIEQVEVPEKHCSCHINPPCSDCVDNGALRIAVDEGKALVAVALAEAQKPRDLDVARKLKETLFSIINHEAKHRSDAYYGGVIVDTPDGPRLAYLRLSFEVRS